MNINHPCSLLRMQEQVQRLKQTEIESFASENCAIGVKLVKKYSGILSSEEHFGETSDIEQEYLQMSGILSLDYVAGVAADHSIATTENEASAAFIFGETKKEEDPVIVELTAKIAALNVDVSRLKGDIRRVNRLHKKKSLLKNTNRKRKKVPLVSLSAHIS